MLSKSGNFGGVARAIFAVLLGAVVMTGCATRDPRLLDALKGTRVTEVGVESAPDVSTGLLPMMNGMTSAQQASMVVAALQKVAARDLRGYPGGQIPTRLVITLQQADLASEPG